MTQLATVRRSLGCIGFLVLFDPIAVPMLSAQINPEVELLQQIAHERSAETLRTAKIEWAIHIKGSPEQAASSQFYSWQAAGADYLITHQGDAEGVVMRGPDGKPANYTHVGPISFLKDQHQVWMHQEKSTQVDVRDLSTAPVFMLSDLRRLGIDPVEHWSKIDEIIKQHGYPPLEYSREHDNGLDVIVAKSAESEFRWWLDPAKSYSVVRTAVHRDGKMLGEYRCTLEQFDGVWFPKRVEHYRYGAGDQEGDPSRVFEICQAEFNRPEHPSKLTPESIGIEPGMQIVYHDRGPTNQMWVWDGSGPAPLEDFYQRVAQGQSRFGPTVARQDARFRVLLRQRQSAVAAESLASIDTEAGAVNVIRKNWRRVLSIWEAYTRDFIQRHDLDQEQQQRAWTTLRRHQETAGHYLSISREKLEQAENELARATNDERPKAEEKLAELCKPIAKIFETGLKPGLWKLLTREQQKRSQTTTQPAVDKKNAQTPPTGSPEAMPAEKR